MKYLAAALALAGAAASAAPPLNPALPPADLRQALRQYDRDGGASPRQLSPVERAELRRQLSEYQRPAPVRRQAPQPQGRR
jgi:hypothetical protein